MQQQSGVELLSELAESVWFSADIVRERFDVDSRTVTTTIPEGITRERLAGASHQDALKFLKRLSDYKVGEREEPVLTTAARKHLVGFTLKPQQVRTSSSSRLR